MARRGSSIDTVCVLCGEETETIEHLLLYCSQVQLVWYASSLRIDMKHKQFAKFQDFLWTSMEHFSPQYISILAYTAWEIWDRRNSAIFDERVFRFHEVIQKASDGWAEYDQGRENIMGRKIRKETVQKWEKPARDQYKLNTDIAVWPDGRVGFGFVVRDHDGNIALAGKKEAYLQGSSDILEVLAIRYALEEVLKYRLQVQQMECDNANVVEKISGKVPPDLFTATTVQEVQQLMGLIRCSTCKYIPRQANEVAHYIAHGPNFISIRHNPTHVISFIEVDVIA